MSNPLHDLYIQAEQPDTNDSLMKVLSSLNCRYEYVSLLHKEANRTFTKYKDLASGRETVLVQLNSEKESDLQKFALEIQLSSRLQHPGIVPVYDAGKNDSGPYYARKWINEKSLAQRIDQGKKIWHKEQALRIIFQVCEAVNYAHSQGISHGNLTAGKIFISESGNALISDWSRAAQQDLKEQEKDLKALGSLLLSIIKLCKNFDTVPGGLKAISSASYANVKSLMEDLQAYRDGYVPKAVNFFLLKSAFQVFKRNPLFSVFLVLAASFIVFLSIWFFDNLKERQTLIDANLTEAEKNRSAANKALKDFQKENELRNEISMEAAEAHAAQARTAMGKGDLDRAREMGSIAWQLNKNEKYTREVRAHLSFIDQKYEQSIDIYKDRRIDYFQVILNLSKKYLQKPPDISQLLQDYEKCDRKELMIYSVNRLLFRTGGDEFREKFIEIARHFNPDAELAVDVKFLEGAVAVSFSGSRNLRNLDFLQGMPIQILDISNSGILEADLQAVPQLEKLISNKEQKVKILKKVERISK